MTIRAIFSTMGKASPSTVADDAGRVGGYRWRGIPDWTPGDERFRGMDDGLHPANAKAMAARKERLARYARLRLDGKEPAEAAELTGLSASAGREYEREFKRQQEVGDE